MHQLIPLKLKLYFVIGLAAIIGHVATAFGFGQLTIGMVISVVEIIVIFLATKTWGWISWVPGLPPWTKVNLNGAWEGAIESEWRLPATDKPIQPLPVTAQVHQNWQHVLINLQTDGMQSDSQPAVPSFDPITKRLVLRYFFKTEPRAKVLVRNPPQRLGCACAIVESEMPDKMTIAYTNERGPGGDITLYRIIR